MGRIKLLHVHSFRNRHGTMVHYFRKRGCKGVRVAFLARQNLCAPTRPRSAMSSRS
jgi:hypothetical protein